LQEIRKFLSKQAWAQRSISAPHFQWGAFMAKGGATRHDGHLTEVEFVKFYIEVIQPWADPPSYSGTRPSEEQGTAAGGGIERKQAFSRLQAMADGTPVKPDSHTSLDRANALQARLAAMGKGK